MMFLKTKLEVLSGKKQHIALEDGLLLCGITWAADADLD
jgi:hypothetical protein